MMMSVVHSDVEFCPAAKSRRAKIKRETLREAYEQLTDEVLEWRRAAIRAANRRWRRRNGRSFENA
jgi:hypothetical protein